jgi:hypothetical protein
MVVKDAKDANVSPFEGILHPCAGNAVNKGVSIDFTKYNVCILDRKTMQGCKNP